MFTGIVEEIGVVRSIRPKGTIKSVTIAARRVLDGTGVGDSIAVNGACLTITAVSYDAFTVDLMPETLRRSNLGSLRAGSFVNLERALAIGDRLGGHFVQGHVDGVGRITAKIPNGEALIIRIEAPPEIMRYVVPKGFIAIDGVSLTVVECDASSFTVSLVPYTLKNTILGGYRVGDRVNVEVDILGKLVEKMLTQREGKRGGVTEEFLVQYGY